MSGTRVDFGVFQDAASMRLPLPAPMAATLTQGARGLESMTASVPTSPAQSYDLIERLGSVVLDATAAGMTVGAARVEDIALSDTGADLTALGPWNELSDTPYTGLWSTSGTPGWFATSPAYNASSLVNRQPEMYVIEISEYIQIALTKGASYGNLADVGGVGFRIPNGSDAARQIVGLQFTVNRLLPADWAFRVNVYADDAFTTPTTVLNVLSTGALATSSYHLTFAASGSVEIFIVNVTGGASAPAGETGSWYAQLSDLRITTTIANRVNTTTASLIFAGTLPVTVGSSAGMYIGQPVVINSGGVNSEIVTVITVPDAVTFSATFANAHAIGVPVQALRVSPDEVVASLLSYATTASPGVLSSGTALISASERDLFVASWEDVTPADIIADLAARDGYETGATGDGRLYWRPAGSAAQSWYIDAAELTIQQSLSALVNAVIGRYQADDGRTLRTAAQVDAVSAARYGRTRTGTVDADTTLAILAQQVASDAASETAVPLPAATLTIRTLRTASGTSAPLWMVRAGDTITIRNLPVSSGAAVNGVQVLRVAGAVYDVVAATLAITPETPTPQAAYQAAAIARAAEIAAGMSPTPAAPAAAIVAPQQVRRHP